MRESRDLYFAVWALALVAEHAVRIGLGVALLAAVHPLLPLLLGAAVLPSLLVRGRAAARIDAATEQTAETARLELSLSETATSAVADRRAGRPVRERGLRPVRRGGEVPSRSRHAADHPPFPDGADGGPHRRARRRPDRAVRHA
ncbi:hypothetical protein ACFMQL_29345 [Nonomuraea fastidiosa]|uniref:hypothetical protein n=1 Tax=Nonomuraea fastidiosa TaxID=46173 RepID=UPI003672E1AD